MAGYAKHGGVSAETVVASLIVAENSFKLGSHLGHCSAGPLVSLIGFQLNAVALESFEAEFKQEEFGFGIDLRALGFCGVPGVADFEGGDGGPEIE